MVASFPDTTKLVPALRQLEALVSLDILPGDTTELSTHVLPVKDQLERADVTIWDFISRHLDVQYTPAGARAHRRAPLDVVGHHRDRPAPRARCCSPSSVRRRPTTTSWRCGSRGPGSASTSWSPAGTTDGTRSGDDAWVDAHVRRLGGWRLAPQLLVEQLAALGGSRSTPSCWSPDASAATSTPSSATSATDPRSSCTPTMPGGSGIEDGAEVRVRSAHGEVRGPVRVDEAVGRGNVSVPHGWGDTNVNVLTSKDDVDPITGMPRYSGLAVSLSAVV